MITTKASNIELQELQSNTNTKQTLKPLNTIVNPLSSRSRFKTTLIQRRNNIQQYSNGFFPLKKVPGTHFKRKHFPPVATTSWGTLKSSN